MSDTVIDAALLGGRLARWCYRMGLQGRLGMRAYEVRSSGTTPLATPLVIAFASDFHAGPTTHPAVFEQLFEAIAAARPDVLLLGGDFVSCNADYASVLIEGLRRCRPRLGSYAVLGNHDLWVDERQLTQLLNAAGVEVLVNRSVALAPPFERISVCGLDDPWTGEPNAAAAFADSGDVRLFLTHSPDGLLLVEAKRFDVGFSGHTHGGQIALRDGTPLVLPSGPLCRDYVHGHYPLDGDRCMIVSRGIGCSTVPIRWNADPEWVLCTLR